MVSTVDLCISILIVCVTHLKQELSNIVREVRLGESSLNKIYLNLKMVDKKSSIKQVIDEDGHIELFYDEKMLVGSGSQASVYRIVKLTNN